MDTGLTNDDYTYYEGFEGEGELTMTTSDGMFPNYHIWESYFTDIFSHPPLHGMGWHGFTRDWQQDEGVFKGLLYAHDEYIITNPKEYLDDMQQYKGKKFFADEVYEVYDLVEKMLRHAIENGVNIVMTYF